MHTRWYEFLVSIPQDATPALAPTAATHYQRPMTQHQNQRLLIIDFGSQVTQLIARRLRELNVYCEIHPFQNVTDQFLDNLLRKPLFFRVVPPASSMTTRRAHRNLYSNWA